MKFHNSILRGEFLPNGIYMTAGAEIGYRDTYDAINDFVECGCWDDDNGNHLESFKKYIEDIYGENSETPNLKIYKEHQVAINYFKACKELYY